LLELQLQLQQIDAGHIAKASDDPDSCAPSCSACNAGLRMLQDVAATKHWLKHQRQQ
jgi:hypothetical protein